MQQSVSKYQTGFWKIILLLIAAGATVLLVSPVSALPAGNPEGKPAVTIVAQGDGSYYLGEKVVFSGINTVSDSTFLFITGPNLPENGGKLTSPLQNATSGDPGSFAVVKTKVDKTWDCQWYTSDLMLDAGTYTIYAASRPKAKDQLSDVPCGTTGIIVKKPFILAGISPSPVVKGKPFTVTGTAEGIPSAVQLWIFGDNYVSVTKISVNPDASFAYTADAAMSGKLPKGQNYLFVQHPMQNDRFDIDISGDFIRNVNFNNGTNLFKITGPGSLQGSDAAEALVAAFNLNEAPHDMTVETYAVIPFVVVDVGMSTPAQDQTQHAPLQFALFGAIALVFGISVWSRR